MAKSAVPPSPFAPSRLPDVPTVPGVRLAACAAGIRYAGRTDLMIGLRHGAIIHVPLPMVIGQKRRVDPHSELWTNVLASTGQPARFE